VGLWLVAGGWWLVAGKVVHFILRLEIIKTKL